MKIKIANNGTWFVEIGCKVLGGKVQAHRFELGTKLEVAEQKADRLWALWQTQDGLWTDEGLRQGKEIAREKPPGKRSTFVRGRRKDPE